MTDTKPDSAQRGTEEFRMETRELHAEELDGDSEDYHADCYRELKDDGSDQ